MLVGYLSVRYGPLTRQTMKSLGEFTMAVSLPCALFTAVSTRNFAEVVNLNYLLTLGLAGSLTQLVTWAVVGLIGTGPKRKALAVLAAAMPNSVFLGFPIFLMVIPDHAGPVVAMNLLIENIVLIPVGMILLARADEASQGETALRVIGRSFVTMLKRPLIIGLLLGLAVVVLGITPPEEVVRFTSLLGQASAPLALVVIGGSLFGLNLKGDLTLATLIAAAKMVVHPVLILAMLSLLTTLGVVTLGPELTLALLLTGALPTFSIFVLFAQEAGHEGLASLALLIATVFSFVTINATLILML